MNFNTPFLRFVRLLFFPVSLLYGVIIHIRNYCYDRKIIRSVEFELPVICVGNLSIGGTGKSPMVEYLIALLKPHYKIATLSRGYKRKSKGYVLADENTTVEDIGDEPMQFHLKYPDITVAAGEDRILAIPRLIDDVPDIGLIILDDAFQHRAVVPKLNILLSDYNNIFTRDVFLPTGSLRDQRSSYKRSNIIVITKCPPNLTKEEKQTIIKEIKHLPKQKIFFTTIQYGTPYHLFQNDNILQLSNDSEVLIVSGIAHPEPLVRYISQQVNSCHLQAYKDHHNYRTSDIQIIQRRFEQLSSKNKYIITTEKNATRLSSFRNALEDLPVYVIPIQHKFLFDEGSLFDETIRCIKHGCL